MKALCTLYTASQCFDSEGLPLANGQIFTYFAGTTTPVATFTDNQGLVPHTNPIVLDSSGYLELPIWVDPGVAYKLVLKNALGEVIPGGVTDNVSFMVGGGTGSDYLPLAGGQMTGPLYLAQAPTDALEAATKQYVDENSGGGATAWTSSFVSPAVSTDSFDWAPVEFFEGHNPTSIGTWVSTDGKPRFQAAGNMNVLVSIKFDAQNDEEFPYAVNALVGVFDSATSEIDTFVPSSINMVTTLPLYNAPVNAMFGAYTWFPVTLTTTLQIYEDMSYIFLLGANSGITSFSNVHITVTKLNDL